MSLLNAALLATSASDDARRSYRLDDAFQSEEIRDFTFSPDGHVFAFIRRRASATMPQNAFVDDGPSNSDIWVQDGPGRPARNLTNGDKDQSGWWGLQWAPDGQRLAFLSSRGGRVTLWVWERTTDELKQVSPMALDYDSSQVSLGHGLEGLFRWVDSRRLLCVVAPKGTKGPLMFSARPVAQARAAWDKAERGELTVSVVNSHEYRHESRELWLVDIAGQATAVMTILSGVAGPTWWSSPGGRWLAAAPPQTSAYAEVVNMRMGLPRELTFYGLDGRLISTNRPLPAQVLAETFCWSPDGTEAAFFAYGDAPINPLILFGPTAAAVMPDQGASLVNPAKLWRVKLPQGRVEQIDTGEIELGYLGAPALRWTAAGELLLRAPQRRIGQTSLNTTPRRQNSSRPNHIGPVPPTVWWVLGRDGRSRPLFARDSDAPSSLEPVEGGAALIGIRNGEIWRVDTVTGALTNLTSRVAAGIVGIRAPDPLSRPTRLLVSIVANSEVSEKAPQEMADSWLLDVGSQTLTRIERPDPRSALVAFDPSSRSVVFRADDQRGTVLWRAVPDGPRDKLVEANTFRQHILTSELRVIDFVSANGEPLKAGLSLPLGYRPSRRYPVVVQIYPSIPSAQVARTYKPDPSRVPSMSVDAWAAAGYVYLFPSIPRNLPGLDMDEGDSIFMQANAVLPAVERLIALGIADPDRLFLSGSSAGGWSVVSLLVQTTRFKAAMAGAGVYNPQVFTLSGALPGGFIVRYNDAPHDMASPTALLKGYSPSDLPWWRNAETLRRNSPLSYVDRIRTPLLIVHGELDGAVSFSESEDLFRALSAMRRPAQFARYWGEPHIFKIIANIKDRFLRTLAWFDDFGDITRDANGRLIFEGDRVKSRQGKPALKPDAYLGFDLFLPTNAPLTPMSVSPSMP